MSTSSTAVIRGQLERGSFSVDSSSRNSQTTNDWVACQRQLSPHTSKQLIKFLYGSCHAKFQHPLFSHWTPQPCLTKAMPLQSNPKEQALLCLDDKTHSTAFQPKAKMLVYKSQENRTHQAETNRL